MPCHSERNAARTMRALVTVILTFTIAGSALARSGRIGMPEGRGVERERPNKEGFVAQATGLAPRFPDGVVCAGIASPYGSPTRYDGSRRSYDVNGGTHGGMDISLAEGEPLLAVADGEVINKGSGGLMEGHFIWLRFPPASTGLPLWTFAKYQHLREPAALEVGATVRRGEAVALGGRSGTQGGHYGANGYPHLHLSTFYADGPDFTILGRTQNMVKAASGVSGDPMILYAGQVSTTDDVVNYRPRTQTVPVAVKRGEGYLGPDAPNAVWPVGCRAP